ncbi:unnamed protein product [Didymodactylos carnosus]|uniref:EF-hand domain-containing protein n=1 Tax=Didymodactylos carnosus TaxID=1234261 RepID=A0A815BB70_9BILA|nr:unnamed protein product [Didymodactylos carnosus]CAF4053594.1 unnamed protein product [Didymodactylos carnosus]
MAFFPSRGTDAEDVLMNAFKNFDEEKKGTIGRDALRELLTSIGKPEDLLSDMELANLSVIVINVSSRKIDSFGELDGTDNDNDLELQQRLLKFFNRNLEKRFSKHRRFFFNSGTTTTTKASKLNFLDIFNSFFDSSSSSSSQNSGSGSKLDLIKQIFSSQSGSDSSKLNSFLQMLNSGSGSQSSKLNMLLNMITASGYGGSSSSNLQLAMKILNAASGGGIGSLNANDIGTILKLFSG